MNEPERRVCGRCGATLVPSPCVAGLWLTEDLGPERGVCGGEARLHEAWPLPAREALLAAERPEPASARGWQQATLFSQGAS